MIYIIDAGVENIHIAVFSDKKDEIVQDVVTPANDRIQEVLTRTGLFTEDKQGILQCNGDLYITGKLSEIIREAFNKGIVFMPAAALWAGAKRLLKLSDSSIYSIGIIEASASGYMTICIDHTGELIEDSLSVNPRCGAGSGINLNRILEKLDISRDSVDSLLSDYLGEQGKEKRQAVPVRSDRCGVFSSSATISDKNQGIPLNYALAITMKSEILKACRKINTVDRIYLTGRIFTWQYARDCACDFLHDLGITRIEYDTDQSILIHGVRHIVKTTGKENIRTRNKKKLRKPETLIEHPSFNILRKEYVKEGIYTRLSETGIISADIAKIKYAPVNIGLDVGSTMAKMTVSDAKTGDLLFVNSYNNHGDTIETIKYMFSDLRQRGTSRLNIQNIGVTGSGRYQVQKSLQAIYPHLSERIFTLVENYAHAHGSFEYALGHIAKLKSENKEVNEDFCVLIDIGGEDTKVSILALRKNELFDNAMNIKCSAGTGSLMDTLKALFNIQDIKEACRRAFEAPKAYVINATCAVFLMENARKMQAKGFGKEEILASCNYAIVENMARTLWNQVEFPKNAVILLHGQTMLSDPLPLAVTKRIQEYIGTASYCLVPPLPGHRACLGLIKSMDKTQGMTEEYCDLNEYIDRTYERRIITCKGAACGDTNARCARTRLISHGIQSGGLKSNGLQSEGPLGEIKLTLGGCTAVNEMQSRKEQAERIIVPDSYRELWNHIAGRLPQSDMEDRIVIPRSFAISEYAYFFGRIFERLGFQVHCDNVQEYDIFNAQPLFAIDTCAPNIGSAGQLMRLAEQKHGYILLPQIDYLPTKGASLGRTCTTNQGGVAIAMHFARMKYPDARFLFFNISLKNMDIEYIADQAYRELQPVFKYYKREISKKDFIKAVELAHNDNINLIEETANKTADYIEQAIKNKLNISIICAREYIQNPGIYDSHIGKLMRDKGVIALPSYAFEADLDRDFGYMYWKNPHDILTKMNAIANKRLNEILIHPRLKELIRKIEHGLADSLLSVVQISTFRCGPDTVTIPATSEITKNVPSLFIQSDAMIKELAHLENRVNTHLNQLNKRLHEELSDVDGNFHVEFLKEFVFDSINSSTDVLYIPTLSDNRMLSSVIRAAGITVVDNYEDDTYDLISKTKLGRKYAGDTVCIPLSAVYADILLSVQDFISKKKMNDPLVHGKSRVLVFMNGGDGPCRLGQYVDIFKLLLYRHFKNIGEEDKHLLKDFQVKILVNMTSAISGDNYNSYIEEWVGFQGFQSIIIQGILHLMYMKAAVSCIDNEEYKIMLTDFYKLKRDIYYILENNIKPKKFAKYLIRILSRTVPKLGGIAKYFGYGLYRNNGLRKPLKEFAGKWVKNNEISNPDSMRVYVDGEVYVRVAQLEEIFKTLIDEFGFQSFELNYTPIWCFLEYILHNRILVAKDEIKKNEEALSSAENEEGRILLISKINERNKFIRKTMGTVSNFRNILAGPLYKAAGLEMPYSMENILHEAESVLPSLKPHGELAPYVGEAIKKLSTGTDLFFNIAPEGCMVSSMGEILTPKITEVACRIAGRNGGRIQHLFSMDGEIDEELLFMAFLKKLGPERYYRK